ncbi:hypothetical protein F1C76_06840 [Geodermatophilaceae bacterium NBWT11]|nr:hypothetical protein F1C76_06840 [Geodermatophilaceae bacterium NBWT11]
MSDGTKAKPDSISEFGTKTVGQTTELAEGFSTNASNALGANVGASTLESAKYFQGTYANHAEALAAFIAEAGDGLMSLGYAGVTVAQNYRDGDAEQQGGMDAVDGAFRPPAGSPSLQRDRDQNQQNEADGGSATGNSPTTWTPPALNVCTPGGATTTSDGERDPFQEVQDLNDELDGADGEFDAEEKADETRENVEGPDEAPATPSPSPGPQPFLPGSTPLPTGGTPTTSFGNPSPTATP